MARVAVWLLLVALAGCGDDQNHDQLVSAGIAGSGNDQFFVRDCAWLSHEDPELMNIFFPDTQAHYWFGVLAVPPGGSLVIEGAFPHARYMSFNVYDPSLAPFDSLNDLQIAPLVGHVNPFAPGADRGAIDRRYQIQVSTQSMPENPAERLPNTLYIGQRGVPMPVAPVMYRVYVPDDGVNVAGNVDLPNLRIFVGGVELPVPDKCDFLERTRLQSGLNDRLARMNLSTLPVPISPSNPLEWKKFHNPLVLIAETLGRTSLGVLPIFEPLRETGFDSGLSGGYLSNLDNNYIAVPINNSAGRMLLLGARAPRTPRTSSGPSRMPESELRYLSLCSVDFPSQRFWDCIYDEELVLDQDGSYVVVVGHADERPSNARSECGITWLNWGPLSAAALIMRHMLPDPDFPHSVQRVTELDAERDVLGPYYPTGGYLDRQAVEALSSEPAAEGSACQIDRTVLAGLLRSWAP